MQIANPIYDVVFKYLMEDAKIARLLISSIIGEEIEELDFCSQEFTSDINKNRIEGNSGTLTVYSLDFNAKIKTDEGMKQVLIELQKAKFATDIMRFRNYLAGQYSNHNNTKIDAIKDIQRRVGIPIISIYFLGHMLDHTDASIIGVNRTYRDLVTGEQITVKESFIESLSHDSYVIQIPQLAKKRRNDLEKLLSIFDQSECIDDTHHILNINEEDYPEKYRELIRRLQSLIMKPEIRKQMKDEDTVLIEFEDMQREIMRQREKASEAEQKASEAKQEASEVKRLLIVAEQKASEAEQKASEAEQKASEAEQKASEAEQKASEAEQKASEAEQKASEAEQKAQEAKKKIAASFKVAGVALEIIMQATGLSQEEIEAA